MKVLLISSYTFGYLDYAVEEMKSQGHKVVYFYYDRPPFKYSYKNKFYHLLSGMKKIFGINEKKEYRHKFLVENLKNQKFDKILIVHGQYMLGKTHVFLKSISKEYIAFFFDGLGKMPRQRNVIQYFDKIYSYDPEDCKNENFTFLNNFIPTEKYRSRDYKYMVFNISSLDHRLEVTKRLAEYFNKKGVSYNFQLRTSKIKSLKNFKINKHSIDISETMKLIQDAKVILDIKRNDQSGLSFRPYEALGNEKKIITTNADIKNYDFYNPINICIINEQNIEIPDEFFEIDYEQVPDEIYEKYSLRTWVKKVLNE